MAVEDEDDNQDGNENDADDDGPKWWINMRDPSMWDTF